MPYLKQSLFFLIAVLLPSTALVLLSIRLRVQEQELAEKRLTEQRERLGRQYGEALGRELRAISDRALAVAPAQPDVEVAEQRLSGLTVVARVVEDRLVLPWEGSPEAAKTAESLRQRPFAQLLTAGQRAEFGEAQLERALTRYREAVGAGTDAVQRAHATLASARVLLKLGAHEKAAEPIESVRQAPLSVRDEFNIPLALYAAGLLLREGRQLDRVFATLTSVLSEPGITTPGLGPNQKPSNAVPVALGPAAACLVRDYLDELGKRWPTRPDVEASRRRLEDHLAGLAQAARLKADFPAVRAALTPTQAEAASLVRWTLYGDRPWLVGLLPLPGTDESVLLGVDSEAVAARVRSTAGLEAFAAATALVRGPRAEGVWLGEAFPGLQVVVPRAALSSGLGDTRGFYAWLIVVVVGVTLFGGYLWWRDTRRELKLAQLRSDFVASVSHELKTPLTSVQMLAETLRLRELGGPERHEYLDLILSESNRLGRLLKNVLDFAQVEKGTRVYQPGPVKLGAVLEALPQVLRQPLQEKRLVLEVSGDADLEVNADPEALEQAVLNLLYNAIKYSPPGGRIALRIRREARAAVIEVADQGVGIHPREHRRIFERFYRAPEEHNRRVPGTGLGLALVKHIIESHGGQVTVESAPAKGSTFTIRLPLPGAARPT